MANCMAKIAEFLGVKLNEVFYIEDSDLELHAFFKITEDGLYSSSKSEPYDWMLSPRFQSLIRGDIELTKLSQKPAIDDLYCYPNPMTPSLWDCCVWKDDELDNYRFQHGFVLATREEAIAVALEMLNILPKRG